MSSRAVHLLSTLLLVLLTSLTVLPVTAAPASATPEEAVNKAVAWIRTQQQADGSFAGFGAGSTADAMLALAAAGENPAALATAGKTPLDFLSSQASEIAESPGLAAKVAIALLVSGRSPQSSLGVDLIEVVNNSYAANTGHYGADVTAHALALLALRAGGVQVPEAAIAWLNNAQLDDGSWSFSGDRTAGAGDTNTTALAIQALVAHGHKDSQPVQKAIAYLHTQQNADGGFPYSQTSQHGNASDTNSTAYVAQALIAAGQNLADWQKDGQSPIDRLLAFQNASGAFRYQDAMPDDNQLATYQAVPPILGVTFPLEPLAIIQQPQPEQPTATPALPLPETGVAEQPATLPNTGAPELELTLLAIPALALVLLGLLVRSRKASAE